MSLLCEPCGPEMTGLIRQDLSAPPGNWCLVWIFEVLLHTI